MSVTDSLDRNRELDSPAWVNPVAWLVTGACVAVGLVGFVWRFTGGHGAADYGSYVPWGLWIAAYVTLIGMSAGAFALAALIYAQRLRQHYRLANLAMLVALATFAAGMTNVWLDLGHPFRAYKLLTDTTFSSVMGVMAWLYVIYGIILVVGLFAARRGTVPPLLERLAPVAFLFAILFAGAEGALFGVVGAQPLWESGLTPVLFLVEAALVGTAVVAAAAAAFGALTQETARKFGTGILVLLGVLLVLEWSEYSTGLTAAVPAKSEAIETILTGDFWWVFWFMHLGLGIVIPAALLLRGRSKIAVVGVAGGLVAAMGLASKLNLVVPALAQEEIEGLADAYHGDGLATEYFPSVMEWMVWLGTLGLAGMVVLLGRRYMSGWFGVSPLPQSDDDSPAATGDTNTQDSLQEADA